MHPLVVNIKYAKCDVYIGRSRHGEPPSKFGNLFVIGKDGTREEVIVKYEVWLRNEILEGRISLNDLMALKGKRLGCFCSPLNCHGEVIVKIINELLQD